MTSCYRISNEEKAVPRVVGTVTGFPFYAAGTALWPYNKGNHWNKHAITGRGAGELNEAKKSKTNPKA